MLQQVIFVEKTKFVYKLVSQLFMDISVNCYVVDSGFDQFSYHIDDLQPQALIINLDNTDFELCIQSINASKYDKYLKICISAKDKEQLSEEVRNFFDSFYKLPISPYDFVIEIQKLCGDLSE